MSGNAMDFLQSVSGYVASQNANRQLVLATIDPAYDNSTYPTTLPKVTFDGESTLSGKRYVVAGNYLPSPSDRVVMAPVGITYVILGSVNAPASRSLTYSNTIEATNDLVLTTSSQDVPGLSVTVTTRKANAKWEVDGIFDYEGINNDSSVILLGNAVIDTVTAGGEAHCSSNATGRITVGMIWGNTFATAGAHTIKLTAKVLNSGNFSAVYKTHTKMRVRVYE